MADTTDSSVSNISEFPRKSQIEKVPYNSFEVDPPPTNYTMANMILALTCLANFAEYFYHFIHLLRHICIENPVPLQKELQKELMISATQYTLMFSLFALPNTVLPLFAGYMADRLGRRYFHMKIQIFIDQL